MWRATSGVAFALLLVAGSAAAQTGAGSGAPAPPLVIRWSMKGTGVASEANREALWRGRVEPTLRLGPATTFEAAYEQRVFYSSVPGGSAGLGLLILPAITPPPYRLTPLDWEIDSGSHASWRHEIDRAVLRATVRRVGVSAGRQAVGWGRGVLFGAIDLFSPFSPFEVDREWRRGVDAVRVEAPLAAHASADAVAAFAARAGEAAYAGRVRGYAGTVDAEVVGGWRAGDAFGGAASSFVIGSGEVHVEFAAFRTPAAPGSTLFRTERTVVKAVVGGSTRVPIGSGVLLTLEYHYSGFGADGAAAIGPSLSDPEFAARLVRGDSQILTRHAAAVVGSYEGSPLLAGSLALVVEPSDGSGILTPSMTLTFNDRWSLIANGYVSFGRDAPGLLPESAYGAVPNTALVQIRYYR